MVSESQSKASGFSKWALSWALKYGVCVPEEGLNLGLCAGWSVHVSVLGQEVVLVG